ncbi:hypothetical protein BDP27DRAFT_1384504 [Rhodocollybia butyracea]|uniref:Transposase n=1 Tax=Rhodocollybia butyracea TaxID=206335 RepID=A0A9P5U3A8_9AGAR|nr:hypothetical protein BDP27DRAFT_1384504 [Rhodocollybia butyracea]
MNDGKCYHPFASQLDWEIAQWAVTEKISQKALDRLLKVPQVQQKLGLSYEKSRGMLKCIDEIPERCGKWWTKQLSFHDKPGEHFTVYHRDSVEAIKALWGDPAFAEHLVYKPQKLFRGAEQTENNCIYSEMWTTGFWNAVQHAIPVGGTVCPVIIASDNLTRFSGNKSVYPVYLTIGNLPKALRRKPSAWACVLIAYLLALQKKDLKLQTYEIFHCSMAHVLEPLKSAGNLKTGGIEMVGGDGNVRKVYPLLCTYVADYPKQCLVTCTKYGTCLKCQRKANDLGLASAGDSQTVLWTLGIMKEAHDTSHNVAGGIEPFWKDFPLTDIHDCITPDILHQLCHFKKGIADFSQVTGTEHKHIARILLASLTGKVDQRGIVACKALLNFIHLAQYPSHDEDTLGYMDLELNVWHKNKAYFVEQQTTKDQINIPKFHSLLHYVNSIKWLGTTDNYNTEAFECFHIDMAKEAWDATNKRDHFPQMTQWLSRQEKILSFDFYRNWINSTTKHPQETKKSLNAIANSHNAPGFIPALKLYLNSLLPKEGQVTKAEALSIGCLSFTLLDVWHHFKFTHVPKEIVRTAPSSIKKNSKSKGRSPKLAQG